MLILFDYVIIMYAISGFMLHSWVHAARPDIRCIIQVRAPAVLTICSLKSGLLPITKEAAILGDVSTHFLVAGLYCNFRIHISTYNLYSLIVMLISRCARRRRQGEVATLSGST